MTMLRDCTGLNEARDGSTPDPHALVGVQKLAALNSNTATRHILDGSLSVIKRLAEGISLRVSDILEYSEHKEEFVNQIGKYNVGIIDKISDLYLHDFGIFIDVSPDEEEKQQLEANIQIALSKGDVNLEDAIDIRTIKNVKLANQLLKVKRKAKEERDDAKAMMQQQMQAEQQMQIQQMSAQSAAQKIQMEAQAKIQVREAEAQFDMQKMQAEAQLKMQLMREEFQYQMQIKGAESQQLVDREKFKEDEKKKRIDRQNSQQSKLINQRKNNLPSMSFESNEDSLDGFDFAEFDPR
jgi:hypothetical protein